MLDITVVIPTIPPRTALLERAIRSVMCQEQPVMAVAVAVDRARAGAAVTRDRALATVNTDWVAFLDDDDEFLPSHLRILAEAQHETGADYLFSWYEVVGGHDPRADEFGVPWDTANPRQTTITTLVRTSTAKQAGFLPDPGVTDDLTSPDRLYAGEDWRFTQRVHAAGAHIHHVPVKSWRWHHHGKNTSGLAKNW